MESLSTGTLWALCLAVGVLPVLAFLLVLVLLDSFKLVHLRTVLGLVGLGGAIALACLPINPRLMTVLGLDFPLFARTVAPVVEEALKGLVIVWALRQRRIGFLVDAAIWGFAVGAGFAAVENVHYLWALGEPRLAIWIIRGFGTAVMHGGSTAMMAVISKILTDRRESVAPYVFLPGLAAAAAVHALFNNFFLSPGLSTLLVLVGFPSLFAVVFHFGEAATRNWLGAGFDGDQEILQAIRDGRFTETRVGRYLLGLKGRFPPTTVSDMLCLIRLHVELSIKAKGVVLMQQAGFEVPPDPEMQAHFEELTFLEKSIGTTGRLALDPIFHNSSRDLWQFHMLRRTRG